MAVNDVEIAVPPAELVGLVGPNGAGKSTLFGVLSGLVRPLSGSVLLNGEDVTQASPQLRADRGLARTFQHPEIFGGLTVRQHLVLAHRTRVAKSRIWSDLFTLGSLRPTDPDETAAVDDLIDSLGLGPVADRFALGLPLGMSRLVELGRALATSPTVLLLDEPSSGLDSTETGEFEGTLRRIARDRGISVLIVEHDVELVMRLCPAMYVLDFGVLIAHGTPDEIRRNPQVRAAYLGEEASPGSDDGRTRPGRTIGGATEGDTDEVRPPTLIVENLCVRYGPAVAVSDASFSIERGQALALLGPNGAGKSSLARSISGLIPAAAGSVALSGRDITAATPYQIRRAGVIHLPEGRGVFRRLSVIDNLRMATAVLHGRQARRDAIDLAFELFPALAERRRQMAGDLSGGEQQMLSLARGLATAPTLLIADELSLGLAPILVDSVFEGLARARESGVTVLMIEQYVHRALAFADQCVVLQRGQVVWQGGTGTMDEDLLRHYLGESMTAVP
ncbi:MAG TPA: ATP-binding cassette domain-containing protein [Acidimicrobiales bacterium]|jgi:ABC-type branched-subunit amino acid transport system ATPase component|nr:ATP-binding cassette domain-containing protein [Acidimicrobiales bacterium]